MKTLLPAALLLAAALCGCASAAPPAEKNEGYSLAAAHTLVAAAPPSGMWASTHVPRLFMPRLSVSEPPSSKARSRKLLVSCAARSNSARASARTRER